MISKLATLILGSKYQRDIRMLLPILRRVNAKEPWALALSKEDLPKQTEIFRKRLKSGESLDDLLPEAFALAREACRRVLGERPYDVQILGGIAIHQGRITEMKTGEGKTLTSVTAAYLNALSGQGVHIVTVNDYLAERDGSWMGRVHEYLGLSVGTILSEMDPAQRQKAYAADITYATNNELGFDYLRDNMRWDKEGRCQRGHHFAIVDEIDSILIDEARTPLIISGPVEEDTSKISTVNGLAKFLKEVEKDQKTGHYPIDDPLVKTIHKGDFKLDEKNKNVHLTDEGLNNIERILQEKKLIDGSLFDEDNFEFTHYFLQALKAHHLFHKDVSYVVQDGGVQIVDEFTGRILHGRRYSDGLHQAIEAKEGIQVAKRNVTLATITFQNFFRMYDKLAGMTGTADTEAHEFAKIYGLDVVVIPSNRPIARLDEHDEIYLNEAFKYQAIADEIATHHKNGQPILVGTVSVERSEKISSLLTRHGIRHEILNAKNHAREALIISEAGAKGAVTIATNMAGRGTDIKLGGNPEMRAKRRCTGEETAQQYEDILAQEVAKWQSQYEEVCQLGGLYVIGTERHESRRIDNQLRGRSGRQGDPGKTKFYISLEDDLMRLFGGDRFRNMMARLGMDTGEALQHPWVSRSIEHAQKRVEDRNYEIRKHLLEYDDVLNKQRTYFYDLRNSVLCDRQIKGRLLKTGNEILEEIMDDYEQVVRKSNTMLEAESFLIARLQELLGFAPENPQQFLTLDREQWIKIISEFLTTNLDEKSTMLGDVNFNDFLRFEYLRLFDDRWQNHLEMMEGLRESVSLRHYAQKNPLVEYKLEGFAMFEEFIDKIPLTLAAKVFRIQIRTAPSEENRKERKISRASHQSLSNLDVMKMSQKNTKKGPRPENAEVSIQVRRTEEKVGRNSPCPCGSGKKYKFCHGKED
ncbi:MAG: preprotein translocase subunit SecA [Spirochaetia bacterium]